MMNFKRTRVLAVGGSALLAVVAAAAVIVTSFGDDNPEECAAVPITALRVVPGQRIPAVSAVPVDDSWARHVVVTRMEIDLQAAGRTTIDLDTCAANA
ncbi:hypothetical protein QRK88_04840 [Mycobacteroides abscessus]|nr:hypothetical protein [Mycobacteroides abscessus]SLI22258.1 Uncharacterised protein [Mycobacteroides abscessus subsp. massiliense]